MWDAIQSSQKHLSHDLPCQRCGHAAHTYLARSDTCACVPPLPPGGLVEEYVGYAAARSAPLQFLDCLGPVESAGSAQ